MAHQARFEEWIGGLISPRSEIVGEAGGPYVPLMVIWVEVGGPIVGSELVKPDPADPHGYAVSVRTLRKSIKQPFDGPPREPHRIRVADALLAEALRADLGGAIPVVVGPTPELEEVQASYDDFTSRNRPSGGRAGKEASTPASDAVMAQLFRASARLYRAAPWDILPNDACYLDVGIEELGIRDHALTLIGALGESRGVLMYPGVGAIEQFLVEMEGAQRDGHRPLLPTQLSLDFSSARERPSGLRKHAKAQGWELAGPDAFPETMHLSNGPARRPATEAETIVLTAVADALADLVAAEPDLHEKATRGGFDRTFALEAGGKPVRVRLSAPAWAKLVPLRAECFDVRAGAESADEVDEELLLDFEEEIVERFRASADFAALAEKSDWIDSYLAAARNHCNVILARISSAEQREILLTDFPRRMSCPPTDAPTIVAQLRAFWAWLEREHGLENARRCRDALYPGFEVVMQRQMANPANFGMAKSMFRVAGEQGFDMANEAEREAFMAKVNAGEVSLDGALDHLMPPGLEQALDARAAEKRQAAAAKKKRKAQRQARKRNR